VLINPSSTKSNHNMQTKTQSVPTVPTFNPDRIWSNMPSRPGSGWKTSSTLHGRTELEPHPNQRGAHRIQTQTVPTVPTSYLDQMWSNTPSRPGFVWKTSSTQQNGPRHENQHTNCANLPTQARIQKNGKTGYPGLDCCKTHYPANMIDFDNINRANLADPG
jgi:hypothetical protein